MTSETTVLGFNTDSLKVRGNWNTGCIKDAPSVGDYRLEPKCYLAGLGMDDLPEHEAWVQKFARIQEVEEQSGLLESLKEGSALVLGGGGCGKSTLLVDLFRGCA